MHCYSRRRHFFYLHHIFFPSLLNCFHRLALSTFSRMNTNSSDEFFQATNHAEQTFRKMETYLQHKQLCDVLLIAGDHKIPAHRLVLLFALILLIASASALVKRYRSWIWIHFKLLMCMPKLWSGCQSAAETHFISSVHLRNN